MLYYLEFLNLLRRDKKMKNKVQKKFNDNKKSKLVNRVRQLSGKQLKAFMIAHEEIYIKMINGEAPNKENWYETVVQELLSKCEKLHP
jgi:hypothetical protein